MSVKLKKHPQPKPKSISSVYYEEFIQTLKILVLLISNKKKKRMLKFDCNVLISGGLVIAKLYVFQLAIYVL